MRLPSFVVFVYFLLLVSVSVLLYSLTILDRDIYGSPYTVSVQISKKAYSKEWRLDVSSSVIHVCPKVPKSFLQLSVSSNHFNPLTDLEKVLVLCKQTQPVPLSNFFTETMRETVYKIGEGDHAEVFGCQRDNWNSSVIKVIPIEGAHGVGDIKMPKKTFESIQNQLVFSLELSSLGAESRKNDRSFPHYTKNFAQVQDLVLCIGEYPEFLLDVWDAFDFKTGSANVRPDAFPEDQLYILVMTQYAGVSLNDYRFHSFEEFISIMQQLSITLAVGEGSLEFEHRCLHRGNVLLRRTFSDSEHVIYTRLDGVEYHINSHGVVATITDYRLSRLRQGIVKADTECTLYTDLNEMPWLFKDKDVETPPMNSQNWVYRLMRNESRSDWMSFQPHSNVLWLNYLVHKIFITKKYKMKKSEHKQWRANIKLYSEHILENQSAKDVFLNVFSPDAVKRIGRATIKATISADQ